MRSRRERGVALVVVLWGIAALSLIALAMLSEDRARAHIGRNAWAASAAVLMSVLPA